ncbi:hypothetical protein FOVSG1_006575 [Fusarium oxysporum f. sp. vasinfectum]
MLLSSLSIYLVSFYSIIVEPTEPRPPAWYAMPSWFYFQMVFWFHYKDVPIEEFKKPEFPQSAESRELCKVMLESATHGQSLETEADLERAFKGLKLRVEVDHYPCAPYDSIPPSSNDISAWGLRAYWIREEMSTKLILRKELEGNSDNTRERPIWTSSRPAAVEALLPTILTWLKECDDTQTSACSLARARADPPRLAHPLRRRPRG